MAAAAGYPNAPRKGDRLNIQLKPGPSLQLFHAGTRCTEEGDQLTNGGRVLAVVAQANDFDQAFANAYQGLDQVYFEGITYRRDIGHQVRQS